GRQPDGDLLGPLRRKAHIERGDEHAQPEQAVQQRATEAAELVRSDGDHAFYFPCPSGFFFVPSRTFSNAVAVISASSLSVSSEYRCLIERRVKKISRGPVSTRFMKRVRLCRSVSRIFRSVSCSMYRRPAGTVGRSLDSAIWMFSERAAPSRSPASCGGSLPMRASWTELRALASRYSSRCLAMAVSASRIEAFPSCRSEMSDIAKSAPTNTTAMMAPAIRMVADRFCRGARRSHQFSR